MSVVPPEFTPVFGVHSDPVTGISGGAFPLRGLESAFARLFTGTCTTRPLSWIQNTLLFFPQCLYTPLTLSSFQMTVKLFGVFCNDSTKKPPKPHQTAGLWGVCCVFRREKLHRGCPPLQILSYYCFGNKSCRRCKQIVNYTFVINSTVRFQQTLAISQILK